MIDTEQVISRLAVGEALISVLDENGQPSPVDQQLIFPPKSPMFIDLISIVYPLLVILPVN